MRQPTLAGTAPPHPGPRPAVISAAQAPMAKAVSAAKNSSTATSEGYTTEVGQGRAGGPLEHCRGTPSRGLPGPGGTPWHPGPPLDDYFEIPTLPNPPLPATGHQEAGRQLQEEEGSAGQGQGERRQAGRQVERSREERERRWSRSSPRREAAEGGATLEGGGRQARRGAGAAEVAAPCRAAWRSPAARGHRQAGGRGAAPVPWPAPAAAQHCSVFRSGFTHDTTPRGENLT